MQKTVQIVLLGFFVALFSLWSIHLGQDLNWDLQNYHYYNGYAFLYNRMQWDIAPAMLQTYINPFLDVTNYLLINAEKPMLTGFVLGALSGLSAFLLFKLAFQLFSEITPDTRWRYFYASAATLIGSTGCATISQLGTTTNENKTALLILLSVYWIIYALQNIKPRLNILLAGLSIGFAVGLKLTASAYGLGIFIGLLLCRKITKTHLGQLALFGLASFLGFLVTNGYWMFKMYVLFQNPLFPYYNNIFHSPYYLPQSLVPNSFDQPNWEHYVFLPFYLVRNNFLTIEASMRDYRLAGIYLFGIIFLAKYVFSPEKPKINTAWRFILITFLSSYIAWITEFTIYRYTIPSEYFVGLCVIFFLQGLITPKRLQLIGISFFTLLILLTTGYPRWDIRVPFGKSYFGISAPQLPSNALVLFVKSPLAYLIPSFHAQTSIRFIGIDNNLTNPALNTALETTIRNVIHNHSGPIFTIAHQKDNAFAQHDLHYYGLVQITSKCKTIKTHVRQEPLLCPVKRI